MKVLEKKISVIIPVYNAEISGDSYDKRCWERAWVCEK